MLNPFLLNTAPTAIGNYERVLAGFCQRKAVSSATHGAKWRQISYVTNSWKAELSTPYSTVKVVFFAIFISLFSASMGVYAYLMRVSCVFRVHVICLQGLNDGIHRENKPHPLRDSNRNAHDPFFDWEEEAFKSDSVTAYPGLSKEVEEVKQQNEELKKTIESLLSKHENQEVLLTHLKSLLLASNEEVENYDMLFERTRIQLREDLEKEGIRRMRAEEERDAIQLRLAEMESKLQEILRAHSLDRVFSGVTFQPIQTGNIELQYTHS